MLTKNNFNPQCITYSQMNLIFNARIYYRRLTTWTRAYIISRYYGIGTAEDQFERLYLESLDIGNMLQIIFGREYSEQYSQLLSQYAIAFRDLLSAQIEGDIEAINHNVDRLYKNVEERAVFLEAINPYWSAAEYKSLFDTYIQHTIEIANAIASEDFSRDIELYDMLNAHTNTMGDTFAYGLYDYITSGGSSQNTDTFQPQGNVPCITYEQMNDIYIMSMLWFELVTWVRSYMLSRYIGIGNEDEVYAKLKEVPVEYVNIIKKYFEDVVVEDYLQLFYDYIELIDAFITAMMEGNVDELNQITRSLYQNADERAAFVASINPFWDLEGGRNRLYTNLRSTIEESTTFLTGDYARNIDIFTRLIDQAENTITFLSQGLFNYIIYNQ